METLVVKRVSKLGKLKTSDDIYYQERKDYEAEGEPFDNFSKDTQALIGSMSNLTPHWNSLKGEWSFFGGLQALLPIAKKLQLRDKNNVLILPDENSFKNPYDPFFGHARLWNSTFIEETSKFLNTEDPLEEFYIRVLQGRDDIYQPSEDKPQSDFLTSRSGLEIMSPKDEVRLKSNTSDEHDTAMELYLSLKQNFDKLKRIAIILDPPSFDESYNDPIALQVMMKHEFVENTQNVAKYGTTARKYFIDVCKMSNEELELTSKIIAAANKGIIRRSTKDGYSFKGEKILDGQITNDRKLIDYFKKDENIKQYDRLIDLLENAD
jgi:hypothetical protein